jgi:hypothetical protein
MLPCCLQPEHDFERFGLVLVQKGNEETTEQENYEHSCSLERRTFTEFSLHHSFLASKQNKDAFCVTWAGIA